MRLIVRIIAMILAMLVLSSVVWAETGQKEMRTRAEDLSVKGIRLNAEELTVNVNETVQILVSIKPKNATNKTITWSTSDKNIATVEGGEVKGISEGTATITAKSDNGIIATCKVIVVAKENSLSDPVVPVKKIKLDQTSLNMKPNQKVKIKVAYSPKNAIFKLVSWSSSNSKVATVTEDGTVEAKSNGDAIITATTQNGISATCKVKVSGTPDVENVVIYESPKSIINSVKNTVFDDDGMGSVISEGMNTVVDDVLNALPVTINMVGKPVKLYAYCLPGNADQTITWSSKNKNVATVSSDGTVTPKGYGETQIVATSKNGKQATATIVVSKKNYREINITCLDHYALELDKNSSSLSTVVSGISSVIDEIIYISWNDKITYYVDGMTGKIDVKSLKIKQEVMNGFQIGIIVEIEKLGGDKMETGDAYDDYVEISSSVKIRYGFGIGKISAKSDGMIITKRYRIYPDGTFKKLN